MTGRVRLGAYLDVFRLTWPLALGMINNAVMQFVDGVFLAHESLASLEASLPASMLAGLVLCFFQSVVAYSGTFVAQYHGARDGGGVRTAYAGKEKKLPEGVVPVTLPQVPVLVPEKTEVLLRCTIAGSYKYPFKKVRIYNCNLEEALAEPREDEIILPEE